MTIVAVIAFLLALVGNSSAASAPGFVQSVSAHKPNVTSLTLTPSSVITTGNRVVVEVGVWSSSAATAAGVSDSAGNNYTELLHFKASENTEMSVWSAPISAGGNTKPTITVKPSATADVGAIALEYSGLSTVADATAVDVSSHASGTTGAAATVAASATSPTTADGELSLGLYVDSGFGDTLKSGTGYVSRTNASPASDLELLAEDAVVPSGTTANATVGTGANTTWLMADLVFKTASTGQLTAPGAPSNVTATAAAGSATVTWNAPGDGGSPITSYTITPYIGATAQTPTMVTGSPPATTKTINGLTNGTAYSFTVTAANAVGSGPASTASNVVTPSSTSGGQWGPLMSWPMVAIHSILLKTGSVLQFDGWQQPEPTQVWNPATQTFTTQTAPDSIFCSGMAELPDGRVLVVGGYGGISTGQLGITDATIFDPATSTWSRVADMHSPRWYPDLTELADGRYVAISGNSTNASTWADNPEVYNPATNTWTTLSNVNTSQVHEAEYPFSYLAPNGNVFTIGPSEDKSFFLNVVNQTWTQVGGSSGVVNGSSVMYRPGKILYSGGTTTQDSSSPAHNNASVIDLTASTPTWQPTAPMNYARVYHTLTMLADGTVLAVGGEPTWGQTGTTETTGGVLPSEIWDPNTQAWSVVASTGVTRGYHSTALLMPDGTVLVGGSGHANPNYPGQNSAQIYSPPYLFKGARPTISAAPATTTYGSTIPITTPDAASISAVNLVSLGSDTHQSDMDQHFVPLSFTQSAGSLSVQIPSNAATAPPGNYMLFIVNSNGVPSVASMINVSANAPTVPGAPTAVTASPSSGSATVSWTAPNDGGSPITSYKVTSYVGGVAQTPTTITESTASATVTGLTNGTPYTFTVAATNAVGTGPDSSPSNAVTPSAATTPSFIQGASAHGRGASLTVTPTGNVTAGDRLVVETGVWSSSGATAASVTDSAGNSYVELLHFKASDGTEMAIWTAPVSAGSGTRPTITVKPTSTADVGAAVVEYSGLSMVANASVLDQSVHASGSTGSRAATVSSGATPSTTAANELALGFYVDSGFGDTLTVGASYTGHVNVSNTSDMELLAEDQIVPAGATPAATAGTGASTTWSMATIVLKTSTVAGAAADRASGVPLRNATRHRHRAHRPAHHRHRQRHHPDARAKACTKHSKARACISLHKAQRITAAARNRFVYLALIKHLANDLFCIRGRARLTSNWAGAWLMQSREAQAARRF